MKQPPPTIGPFRVLRRLGQGGMGTVHLVEDPRTGARRALKTLAPGADLEARRRFAREAEAMARVDDHPHVVRIHAAGEHEGTPYLVMAFAPGGDLAARLKGGPLPPAEVVRLGVALARGLAHVHAQGVLHRDLKPSNVLFDEEDEPRLVDFGLARLVEGDRLTRTGTVLGTPAYMAPEQADGGPDLDARADVYGLGALLYHALTGRPPFEGGGAWAVLDRVLREPPPAPRTLSPGVPPALEAVVLRALAKAPDARYPTADAFADALEAAGAAPARRPLRWRASALALVALAGLLGLTALTGEPSARLDEPPEGVPTTPARLAPSRAALEAERVDALRELRSERPDLVLAWAAARPPAASDPLTPLVAAAARLSGGAAPGPWAASVAALTTDAPIARATTRLRRLTTRLARHLDEASALEAPLEALHDARQLVAQVAADDAATREHPLVVTDRLEVQRAVLERVVKVIQLTGGSSVDRRERQLVAVELLQGTAALEPGSLAALALGVAACAPAYASQHERAATWEFMRALVAGGRTRELEARYPRVASVVPVLWLCTAGRSEVARRWGPAAEQWAEAARLMPEAFDAAGALLPSPWLSELLHAAACVRADAALLRAWDARHDRPALDAATKEALRLADVLVAVDWLACTLRRARAQLLAGDVEGATRTLSEPRLYAEDGAVRNQAERLLVDRHLLAGDLGEATRGVAQLAARRRDGGGDFAHRIGEAITRALAGRHDQARATLASARDLERRIVEADGEIECPWWSVAEVERVLEAIRERGWTPARAGRLYLAPGE